MIPFFFFGFFDTQGVNPPSEPSLFGGVAHFKKLHERSQRAREVVEVVEEVIEIPQEVKQVISRVADVDKKQRAIEAQLKEQLKALNIQFRNEYISELRTEMIRLYLQEQQDEEEAIAMMMIALA